MSDSDDNEAAGPPGLRRVQSGCLLCRDRAQSQSQFCPHHHKHFAEDDAAHAHVHEAKAEAVADASAGADEDRPPVVKKSGWALKRGHGPRFNWKRRFFRLHGPILAYYPDQEALQELGTSFVVGAEVQHISEHPEGKAHVLVISQREDVVLDAKHVTLFVSFDSDEERLSWEHALRQSSARV